MDAENATSYRSLSSHHIRLIDVNTDLLNYELHLRSMPLVTLGGPEKHKHLLGSASTRSW
jgi:hypothetical protein